MKTLKKLTLNKEEIVNLNDFEMRNLKGGTSLVCGCIETAVQSIQGYIGGGQLSWWNCTPTTLDSAERICYNGDNMCLLPNVYVNGIHP